MTFTGTASRNEVNWFREMLASHGVSLRGRCKLAQALVAAEALAEFRAGRGPPCSLDSIADVFDALYLIKALHQSITQLEYQIDWLLFRSPDVCLARQAPTDQRRNRVWEVLAGALCSQFALSVELKGEPDVRCEWNGVRWGLACKVLYSWDPRQLMKLVVKGAKNIQESVEQNRIDRGFVLVNVCNHIPTLFEPVPDQAGHYRHPRRAETAMEALISTLRDACDALDRKLDERLSSRPAVAGVIFFAHTGSAVSEPIPRLIMLSSAAVRPSALWDADRDGAFAESFSRAVQAIPGYAITPTGEARG